MKGRKYKQLLSIVLAVFLSLTSFVFLSLPVNANEIEVKGIQYQFDDDCKYVVKEAKDKKDINGKTQFGEINLDGKINSISDVNGFQAYEVTSGVVNIKYSIDVSKDINVVDDKVKKHDKVIVIGGDVSVRKIANHMNTTHYEVMAMIDSSIPRRYV